MNRLYILLSVAVFSGCSLVRDAIDISQRQKAQLAEGSMLHGSGFQLRVFEPYLYPTKNFPTKGGITLRPVQPLEDGKVYFVAPFVSATAKTPEDMLKEWNSIPANKGFTVKELESESVTFYGKVAVKAIMEITDPKVPGGNISATLVVQTDHGFMILSSGEIYGTLNERSNSISRSRSGLVNLMSNVSLKSI